MFSFPGNYESPALTAELWAINIFIIKYLQSNKIPQVGTFLLLPFDTDSVQIQNLADSPSKRTPVSNQVCCQPSTMSFSYMILTEWFASHSTAFHLNSAPPLRAGVGLVAVIVTGPEVFGLVVR